MRDPPPGRYLPVHARPPPRAARARARARAQRVGGRGGYEPLTWRASRLISSPPASAPPRSLQRRSPRARVCPRDMLRRGLAPGSLLVVTHRYLVLLALHACCGAVLRLDRYLSLLIVTYCCSRSMHAAARLDPTLQELRVEGWRLTVEG